MVHRPAHKRSVFEISMRALSATVIGASVVLVCTTLPLLARIWILRHSFDMAARSPIFLICVSFTTLVMAVLHLLHWFMLLEGRGLGLPCFATFVATYLWYVFAFVPYLLRAVRIAVLYHSSYRYKYAGLVKWRNLRKAWGSISLSIVVFATILFATFARHNRNDYGCAFHEETVVVIVTSTIAGPGMGFLIYKLSQMNDAFKLQREFIWVLFVLLPLTTGYVLIQTLYKTGAIPESRAAHLAMESIMMVIQLNLLFWLVLVSVAMHDGWCGFGISRVIPTDSYSVSVRPNSSSPTRHGVLGYVEEGGPVASMFQHFCARNLCGENWDFIVAACEYEAASGIEEQFKTFVSITEQYLQPTSSQEVNISSQMQTKIASLKNRERFSALSGDSRRDVLQEPLKEIVQVLEQNLLAKFKQTPEMLKWREKEKLQNLLIEQANAAAAEGDENMQEQLLLSSRFISEDGVGEAEP